MIRSACCQPMARYSKNEIWWHNGIIMWGKYSMVSYLCYAMRDVSVCDFGITESYMLFGFNLPSGICVWRTLYTNDEVNRISCWKLYIHFGLLNTHTHIMRQMFFVFLYMYSPKLFLKFCNIEAPPPPPPPPQTPPPPPPPKPHTPLKIEYILPVIIGHLPNSWGISHSARQCYCTFSVQMFKTV